MEAKMLPSGFAYFGDLPPIEAGQSIPIVTLSGPKKFKPHWIEADARLTEFGYAVFSLGLFDGPENLHNLMMEVHTRKICVAAGILVINYGGYIGESTTQEIALAIQLRKHIAFLETPPPWYQCMLDIRGPLP